ncbi:bifunctional diaminohydroxyphosphoribosylaminopyrimidine deaminase/5-amino-6-(5-phosphoribosylamino)uracil reductase RibD [Mobilitalea sibirica]|uniref:Riboflavin biosynthesis protein RibD n=1 Tax=Mobilitalea sibirica TaxID=1462919 RepID=A0A8J7HAS4_9FIRM|nr:bifunctional diaminohydroxyphosphoribosylaminopyrimidine deaminase/5-amino-6-(5-phosphoribosylamino)uracil reductase RibD [Mobilitalea sibirica]MBH1940256.1 bifunctional diaminohydroxyphosphoribosylaminopyrimidine deaminase/5-amino-6-(5-phosphoribosylamino)uracil reductase RibD [Mobilitalea sibirica]
MNEHFMKRAIELAYLGSGFINPDPLSGAVLVKDNIVLGESCYRTFGAASAELEVLSYGLCDLSGAELYLNIEPFGNKAKLTELIRVIKDRKIEKIYIGIEDRNPRKEIHFIEELKHLGISCELGILKDECEEMNEIYSHYIVNKTPYVIVKWAMTLDGKLATKTGDSKWISSEESLRFVHHLRQRVSAILVGENTVRKDDPLLTTRLEGVQISNPIRIIISKYGDIPMEAKVLQVDESTKTWIIASELISKEREESICNLGARILKLKEKNGHIDFNKVMDLLGRLGIDSVYIEGGSAVLGSAFESGCVHKVYTAIAPKIVGGNKAVTPVGGNGIERMNDAIVLKRLSYEIVGPDVIIKGYIY